MIPRAVLGTAIVMIVTNGLFAKETRLFEMRTYYAAPGRLDDLQARFRDHTLKLFEKHGLTSVGYWTPIDNSENKLIYVLAFADVESRSKAWKQFSADPQWKEVRKQTEANGRLVTKVESIQLKATDYSPEVKPVSTGDRVFELRTYTASPGSLDHLNRRFREHTVDLFQKHGITNIAYWNPIEGQPGAGERLVYIIAHDSVDAAKASFADFREDPAWIAARKNSEQQAGGPLTVRGGVKSEFLNATDYSPLR